MVPFAGWKLPLVYADQGVTDSVLFTRNKASLFDVSHMLQTKFIGHSACSLLKWLLPINFDAQKIGQNKLALFLNQAGGIIDDCIITKLGEDYYRVVSNATRSERLIGHITENGGATPDGFEIDKKHSLLALQGPSSANILVDILGDEAVNYMSFMNSRIFTYSGRELLVSRSGYTGEDGLEISVEHELAAGLAERILACGAKPAGLAARDILRIEAGLLLNGQDMNESTHPDEVGLGWTLSKLRLSQGNFFGAGFARRQNRLVGLRAISIGPQPRTGTELFDETGTMVGIVTSGCYSPTLSANIALAKQLMVNTGSWNVSNEILARIRNKSIPYKVVPIPFTPHRFKKE